MVKKQGKQLKIKIQPTLKQKECWDYLKDKKTKFILFGGGAGGAKSWLGCEWILINCLLYPGTKWYIGRNELTRIMKSTYITWLKVCKWHNIPRTFWHLDSKYNIIKFENGSTVDLLDVQHQPSDPLYERFGSSEYTSGWLEEVGEIKERAFEVLKSRIGRHMNRELDIFPKMFLTCNPKKNWVYRDFYIPWKNNTLPKHSCFIQSLYNDNPYTAEAYGEMLAEIKDVILRERLKNGNWEYEDDQSALMSYDAILDIFTSQFNEDMNGDMYLSVDPARFGQDKAVFVLWQGWFIKKVWYYERTSEHFIKEKILSICKQHMVPMSHVVADEGGACGGVVDNPELTGIKGFIDAASAIEESIEEKKYRQQETKYFNYKNLRAQCFFKLAEKVNDRKIGCYDNIDSEVREWITQELEVVKRKDHTDDEKKLQIIPKDEMKETIGRSPDFADAIKMRVFFELNNQNDGGVSVEW